MIITSLLYLSSIEFVEFGVYRISFSISGEKKILTLCRVAQEENDEFSIPLINFDSEEVGKNFMKGLINIRSVCFAISAFHNSQRAQGG